MSGQFTKFSVLVVGLLVISVGGIGHVTSVNTQSGEKTQSLAVVQGEACRTIQPLGNGTNSVTAAYDYRTHNYGYSSYGMREIQIDGTSQLFFYQGNGGLNLVFLHDKVGTGAIEGGGTVTFRIDGLPVTGGWAVKDDGYPTANDSFTFNGSTAVVTWGWQGNRTDGGVFRADPDAWDAPIRIVPHFNRESKAYPVSKWDGGTTANQVERWILRSGDDRAYALTLYQPIVIHPGTCKALKQPTDQPTNQQNESTQNQKTTTEQQHNSSDQRTTPTPQSTTLSRTPTDNNGGIATGPGFTLGIGVAALALLTVLAVTLRRRR